MRRLARDAMMSRVSRVSVEYSMELGGMGALIEKLRSAVRDIEKQLSTLDEEAARLRSSWSGEAATAYDRAHADSTRSLRALNVALDKAAAGAENAVNRHLEARAEVAKLWI